jgi:hypothetical protein
MTELPQTYILSVVVKGRVVVDIRGLNKFSQKDIYPMRTQEEIIRMCQGARFITVLGAKSFFYQWSIQTSHRDRLAVITHRGVTKKFSTLPLRATAIR